jgi:hypothetical protein
VAGLESQFLINAGTPGIDLNLSEQHLVCDSSVGMGGHENLALNYVVDVGITDEATLPYISKSTSPLWPLDRPHTRYQVDAVNNFCTGGSTTTSEIKYWLETTGPLPCAINTKDFFIPPGLEVDGDEQDSSIPDYWLTGPESSGLIGPDDPVGGINHSVCIVGYKDDTSMPEGGFWIIKNSWGAGWRDGGYGFMKYGDVEKHSRIHAVTGNTFTSVAESRAPNAVDDAFSISEDSTLIRQMYNGVRSNDTDANHPQEDLTILQTTEPAHGTLELFENGAFTYVPDPDFYGTDSFRYQAFDGSEYSDTALVTIDVLSVNDAPIAVDDLYACKAGGMLRAYAYEGVLANDYDADNHDSNTDDDDSLTVVVESGFSHGTIAWYAGGAAFDYTPYAGFYGVDSLTYRVFDGTELSNLATMLIEITNEEASETTAVPEPSAVALLAMLAMNVVAFRRRGRSR